MSLELPKRCARVTLGNTYSDERESNVIVY